LRQKAAQTRKEAEKKWLREEVDRDEEYLSKEARIGVPEKLGGGTVPKSTPGADRLVQRLHDEWGV
jgi:hypothetical protein